MCIVWNGTIKRNETRQKKNDSINQLKVFERYTLQKCCFCSYAITQQIQLDKTVFFSCVFVCVLLSININ